MPINKDLEYTENLMRDAADYLTVKFSGLGFVLLVFPFGEPYGIGNYISNADRADMIKELHSTAERLEKRQDIPAALPGEH